MGKLIVGRRSCLVAYLLVSLLLSLSLQQGFGRKLLENATDDLPASREVQGTSRKSRELAVNLMDYSVGANDSHLPDDTYQTTPVPVPTPSAGEDDDDDHSHRRGRPRKP